jgi:tetratricopeptide (TPR) repeat protein
MLFYDVMFLIPVLFLFFTVWGMYRLVAYQSSISIRTWLLTGIIFGLAAISRPNILLAMPLLLLWVYFSHGNGKSFLYKIKLPVVLVIGMIITIAPVTIRNIIVTGDFILISSQGGVNLYLGNNETASGLSMLMPEVDLSENLSWSQFIPATKAAAQREAGRELSDAEQSSFWTNKAVNFIVNNPGKFLGLVWRKCVYLISGFENSDNSDIYYERGKSYLYSALLWNYLLKFPFGLLFPLTILGIYLTRKDWKRLLPLYLFLIGYIPTIVLFLVTARHRLPLIPFMIIIATSGLIKLFQLFKKRSMGQIIPSAAIFIITIFVVNNVYYDEGGQNDFQIHFNAGIKNEHLDDLVGAEKEYKLADQYFPYSASLLTNLGYVQYKLGKFTEANDNYNRALAINPRFHRAYNNLGMLVEDEHQPDSAIVLYRTAISYFDLEIAKENELGLIYVNLARVYEQVGKIDSAAAAFHLAMKKAPLMGDAYTMAAVFFARQEQYALADSLYVEGMRHKELKANEFFNWGLSFMERKRYSDGIGMMLRALKRDSTLHQAYYCIAVGLYQGGYATDSVDIYLDRCLHFDSTYQPAHSLKKMLGKE